MTDNCYTGTAKAGLNPFNKHKDLGRMSDHDPNIPIARFFLATIPLLAAVIFFDRTDSIHTAALILATILSTTGIILVIIRYEADLIKVRRDTRSRLQSAERDLSTAYLLSSIVEGISDPLLLLDRNRKVIQANGAAAELLGENIIGEDIAFHLRHPDALKAVEKATKEGIATEQEITLLDPIERNCLMRVNIFEAPAESVTARPSQYVIISLYDISKIKLAEKMRVDFVANASHELRTPLASLSGFIETLQTMAPGDNETRQKFLKIMDSEASRMRRLIDDLLSLSRIEMDQHIAPSQSVEILGLVKSVIHAMGIRLNDKNISIQIDADENLPLVQGDHDQLVQVFTNLLDNAVKYGKAETSVKVSLKFSQNLPNRVGQGVMIEVFNAGDGIPPEHLPRLTERFYRVDSARSRQLGGTGLGLAIVKHIVNRHRGYLRIESEIGTGTTVKVGLPKENTSKKTGKVI